MTTATPDAAVAIREAESLAREMSSQAAGLAINTPEDFRVGGDLLKAIKNRYASIETKRFEFTRPIDQAKARIMEFFKPVLDNLNGAEVVIKSKMIAWTREQERIRQEEERKARERAFAEQRRLQEIADRRAEKLLEKGRAEEAERVLDSVPEVQVPVIPQTEVPKVKGVSMRTNWKFRIVDEAKIPRDYLVPDEKKIGGVVRALKDKANISGIEVYPEETMAAGGD